MAEPRLAHRTDRCLMGVPALQGPHAMLLLQATAWTPEVDGPNVFQDIYYEPLGGQLKSSDPEAFVEDAIYALREDCGAISGLRKGHECFKIIFGPLGNSGTSLIN